jgi:hypothetical protein
MLVGGSPESVNVSNLGTVEKLSDTMSIIVQVNSKNNSSFPLHLFLLSRNVYTFMIERY